MRDGPTEDYYALLRVARSATAAELRRSYRLLALRYHPDRAGPEGTETFQRIARAYAILSDARSRRAYDHHGHHGHQGYHDGHGSHDGHHGAHQRAHHEGQHHGQWSGTGGRFGWRVSQRPAPIPDLLPRLCGRLDDLIARGIAMHAGDGAIELHITRAEAISGGTATLDAAVPVPCPTCGGCAQRYVLWCRRCEYAGSIVDQVTFWFQIPAWATDGTSFTFASDPSGLSAPLRLRVRIR